MPQYEHIHISQVGPSEFCIRGHHHAIGVVSRRFPHIYMARERSEGMVYASAIELMTIMNHFGAVGFQIDSTNSAFDTAPSAEAERGERLVLAMLRVISNKYGLKLADLEHDVELLSNTYGGGTGARKGDDHVAACMVRRCASAATLEGCISPPGGNATAF